MLQPGCQTFRYTRRSARPRTPHDQQEHPRQYAV